jgi:hypothetical protein
MATMKPAGGKTVMHSKATSMFGSAAPARMPQQQAPARFNVPKTACKVCPGANRMK